MKSTRLVLSLLALVCFVAGCEKSLNLADETFVCNKDEDCGSGHSCDPALKVCRADDGGGEVTKDEGGSSPDEGGSAPDEGGVARSDGGHTTDPGASEDEGEPATDEGDPAGCVL